MWGYLFCTHYWGPSLQFRLVPWTGGQTSDPLVFRPALNSLNYTIQGYRFSSELLLQLTLIVFMKPFFKKIIFILLF